MSTATESSPELIADFVDEGLESLRPLPGLFEEFRARPDNFDPIHAVFRAVHSVKGCAGFLGLVAVKQLAHGLENTLDEVRKRTILFSEDLQRALVRGFDALDRLLQRAGGGTIDLDLSPEDATLLKDVHDSAAASRGKLEPEAKLLAELTELADEIAHSAHGESAAWCQRLREAAASLEGREAVEAKEATDEEVPTVVMRRSVKSFLGVPCRLGGRDVSDAVRELLGFFVRAEEGVYDEALGCIFLERAELLAGVCQKAGESSLADVVRQAAADYRILVDSPLDVDPMLVSIAWDRLEPALVQLLVESPDSATTEAKNDSSAGTAVNRTESAPRSKGRIIRIREECVDEFLESVSGLFLTGELYKDVQSRMSDGGEMTSLVEELRQINNAFAVQSTALQRNVVALRQVAVSGLLSKFPQMARGLADQLGKRIDVHLSGQETEIDKSLVEDLDAPMTHMIRNVVDHALETPDQRIDAGKSEAGNLWIKIEQSKTHVHVTIVDDGRGIDPNILRAKAVEKGILSAEQAETLTDQDAIELIFHAGFSTAKQVSDISGRGVGMDVVRTKIREHNGEVQVESQVGQGTTFRLTIPQREAVVVVDGLLLRHAGGHFVLPFENVLELAELGPEELKSVQGSFVGTLRGRTYDAVSLGKLLELPRHSVETTSDGKTFAVLVGCKQGSFCVLVDTVLGHRKVVVNRINEILPAANRIAGVAQLGGGRLALVLSVQDIFEARWRNTGAHR
ncbi:MAG: chemotaxis protein CheA [Pirellulales bacterium]